MARKIPKKVQEATARRLAEMTKSEIKKLTAKEAKEMLGAARQAVAERMSSLEKAAYRVDKVSGKVKESPTFYSSEFEKQLDWQYEKADVLKKAPSRQKRVDALSELQRYHDFLNAKSSTVSGARDIMKKQDARIFGTDENGKPLQRLTAEQRKNFWSLYNEFLSGVNTADLGYRNYGNLQGEIGKIIKQRRRGKGGKFVAFDLGEAMEQLRKELLADEYDTSGDSILIGEGDNL